MPMLAWCAVLLLAQDPGAAYYPPPPAPSPRLEPLNGQVKLTWTAVPGAFEYKIKRSDAGLLGPYVTVGTTSGTSLTNAGLTNGTTYYYVVASVNGTAATHSAYAGAIPQSLAAPLFFDGFENLSQWSTPPSQISIDGAQGNPLPALRVQSGGSGYTVVNRLLQTARPLTVTVNMRHGGVNPAILISGTGLPQPVQANMAPGTVTYTTTTTGGFNSASVGAGTWHTVGFKISSAGALSWTVNGAQYPTSITLGTSGLSLFVGAIQTSSTGTCWLDNLRVTSP